MTTVVHLNQIKDSDGSQLTDTGKDYRKLLEDKIIEKKLHLELNEKYIKGEQKENLWLNLSLLYWK